MFDSELQSENAKPLVKQCKSRGYPKSRFGEHKYLGSPQRNGEMWLKWGIQMKTEIMKLRRKKGKEGRKGRKERGGGRERGKENWRKAWRDFCKATY